MHLTSGRPRLPLKGSRITFLHEWMCKTLERDFNFPLMFSLLCWWQPKGLRSYNYCINRQILNYNRITNYYVQIQNSLFLMNCLKCFILTALKGESEVVVSLLKSNVLDFRRKKISAMAPSGIVFKVKLWQCKKRLKQMKALYYWYALKVETSHGPDLIVTIYLEWFCWFVK